MISSFIQGQNNLTNKIRTETNKNPKLEITNLKFENISGDNAIASFQTGLFKISIENKGDAAAKNVEIVILPQNNFKGLEFASTISVGDMPIGQQQLISVPVKALKGLMDGKATFYFILREVNTPNSTSKAITIGTKVVKSLTEEIRMYVENKVNEWQEKGEFEKSLEYKVRVNENTRNQKIAEFQTEAIGFFKKQYMESIVFSDVKLNKYDADNECFLLSSIQLGEFVIQVPREYAPGFKKNFSSLKYKNLDFYIKDDNFVLSHIDIYDSNNNVFKYNSTNKVNYSLTDIDYKFTDIQIDVEDKTKVNSNIQKSTNAIIVGKSDVDVDIPNNNLSKTNTYALIIGNEDYSSSQTVINSEVNVQFAENDAKVFREYCIKTLGIPEVNTTLLINATGSKIMQNLDLISKISKANNGNAELIFYYAGHGLPDEQTKEPYIIPVDVNGYDLEYAVKLEVIYKKLTENPTKKVLVFIDACFSGGARNESLIASRGVKVKPKENVFGNNLIIFSSCSGDESSASYKDKQHGMFTYYLLKKLKSSKGSCTLSELQEFLKSEIPINSLVINKKQQTPKVAFSLDIVDKWQEWRIK